MEEEECVTLGGAMSDKTLRLFSTSGIFPREQAKFDCDWVVMSSASVANQSS
jgi:hypothetical protein